MIDIIKILTVFILFFYHLLLQEMKYFKKYIYLLLTSKDKNYSRQINFGLFLLSE